MILDMLMAAAGAQGSAPASITHVGTSVLRFTSSGSIAYPSGMQAGDLVVLGITGFYTEQGWNVPAGFTADVNDAAFMVAHAIYASGANIALSAKAPVPSGNSLATLHVFRGAAWAGTVSALSSTYISTSVNVPANGQAVSVHYSKQDAPVAFATPAGWTPFGVFLGGTAPVCDTFSKDIPAGGASGNASAVVTPSVQCRSYQFAIGPSIA